VEVRVEREDGRHRWMRSTAMTLTRARRSATAYRALGFKVRILCDEGAARAVDNVVRRELRR
jgi:hypothetical protein